MQKIDATKPRQAKAEQDDLEEGRMSVTQEVLEMQTAILGNHGAVIKFP